MHKIIIFYKILKKYNEFKHEWISMKEYKIEKIKIVLIYTLFLYIILKETK